MNEKDTLDSTQDPSWDQLVNFDPEAFSAVLKHALELAVNTVEDLAPVASAVGLYLGHPEVATVATLADHIAGAVADGLRARKEAANTAEAEGV